ncbi:MAG: trigger factor [Candidatus Omnitrophota bacterium]
MKTEIKKIDGTKRELHIEVEGDIVNNKFDDVFKRIGQEAKVAGFRPGHVPRDVLEKHYSSQAHEQVLKELIPDVYNQAIEKEGLDVIELPNIYDVKLSRSNLVFKAAVEVTPDVKLGNYKGIKVEYKNIEVTPEEVKRRIDSLRESRKAQEADDNFARGLGYPGMVELEKAITQQVFLEKEGQQRHKIEETLIETLRKQSDFKLPESMVNRQLADLLRRAKLDLALKGIARDKIDGSEGELRKELEPQAHSQVRTYLVLAAVARKENIPLDDGMPAKVLEFLLKEANWQQLK